MDNIGIFCNRRSNWEIWEKTFENEKINELKEKKDWLETSQEIKPPPCKVAKPQTLYNERGSGQ